MSTQIKCLRFLHCLTNINEHFSYIHAHLPATSPSSELLDRDLERLFDLDLDLLRDLDLDLLRDLDFDLLRDLDLDLLRDLDLDLLSDLDLDLDLDCLEPDLEKPIKMSLITKKR